MKTGILGGTFNPIHLAHLRIAEEVRVACDLDRVLFMPAATPPHKPLADEVSFEHRFAMVQAAVADNPRFEVCDLESRRSGKSFSVATLKILHRKFPEDAFYFIVGMDSYRAIDTWRDYPCLFALANLVVAARPGHAGGDPLALLPVVIRGQFCYDQKPNILRHVSGNRVIFVEETFLDISSTRIRRQVAEGGSIRYLVPAPVENYIGRHALYRCRERL